MMELEAIVKMLVCPETRQPLEIMDTERLADLNEGISGRTVRNQAGFLVTDACESALVTVDGTRLYPVRDGIPILLIPESIAISQLNQNRGSTL